MTKLVWDRYVGTVRQERWIHNGLTPRQAAFRVLMARKEQLARIKQKGLAERRKPHPDAVLLEKLRDEYRHLSCFVRDAQTRLARTSPEASQRPKARTVAASDGDKPRSPDLS